MKSIQKSEPTVLFLKPEIIILKTYDVRQKKVKYKHFLVVSDF